MNGRTALALSLVVLVPGTSALASPRRAPARQVVCNLVTDARGDADGGPLRLADNPTGSVPAYDILSADIASDGRTLTVVIRVAGLADRGPAPAPTGAHWRLDFGVVGSATRLYLQGYSTPFGEGFDLGYVAGSTSNSFADATVSGVFDPGRNEVRVSAPVRATRSEVLIAGNSVFQGLHAYAGPFYNVAGGHPSISDRGDVASSGRNYTVGTKSCVALGR